MRKAIWLAALLTMLSQGGCMMVSGTTRAADYQPTVDLESIKYGDTLTDVEAALGSKGVPLTATENAYAFRFEHTDAWKHRKWIYYAVEAPTAGLMLAVTQPIETKIENDAQRWAIAVFSVDGKLVMFDSRQAPPDLLLADLSALRLDGDGTTTPGWIREELRYWFWEKSRYNPESPNYYNRGQED